VGLAIWQEFEVDEVECAWLDGLPERERFFSDLYSPEITLKPPASTRLTHRHEFISTPGAGKCRTLIP